MFGQFDLTKYGARGLKDDDFLAAAKEGQLDHLLLNLPKTGQYKAVQNRIFDNYAGWVLDHLFQGPQTAYPFYVDDGMSALANITLLTTDGATNSYTESTSEEVSQHSVSETANSSSGGKRFINDQIEPFIIDTNPEANGREDIKFTNKWMYLPSQGASTNIRSIGVYFCRDGNYDGQWTRGRIGRVRIKDANGDNVILHKSSSEVLIVQYSFRLLSN